MSHLITWNVLRSLGFKEDEGVISDPPGGLSCHINGFKLSASVCTNGSFYPIILFTGVYATGPTLAEVHFEMPREVESHEQAAAWLAWSLDQQIGRGFGTTCAIPWLEIGRRNFDLLPWERSRVAYELRPHCYVDRDWMRLALRKLRVALTMSPPKGMVHFGFDGEILKIQTSGELIAVPGAGRAWPLRVSVPAAKLEDLPKRLIQPSIPVSYWESRLTLGNRGFPAVKWEAAS